MTPEEQQHPVVLPHPERPHLSTYASPQAYREAAVLTASPVQLVVMLYDGVERFLRQAEVVMGEGVIVQAYDRMQKAEAIIDELLATLDKSAGQVAERLEAIYVFCKRLLMEARVEKNPAKLAKVRSLLAPLRESWNELAEGGGR
jgi:flagellar protein FliS